MRHKTGELNTAELGFENMKAAMQDPSVMAETMKLMQDPEAQRKVIENMYRYRATIPLFHGEPDFDGDGDLFGNSEEENSVCDIIMEGVEGQVMEVVEHVLHIVTDVGMHYSYPDDWGLGGSSRLATTMEEAISRGIYGIEDYGSIPPGEERQRILLQEYGYWLITSAWDIQTE